MSLMIQSTPWDDQYFNLKTGRVTVTEELTDLEEQELKEKSKNFDLVVIDNSKCVLSNDRMFSTLKNSYLCDIQVRFKLMSDLVEAVNTSCVTIQNNMSISEEILNISHSVYRYSRFKIDPFLDSQKAQEIYIKWCEDAFNNSNKYFAIYKKDKIIDAYILFNVEDTLNIELVAVRTGKQGKGIGSDMLNELIYYCQQKGIKEMKVGTQANNRSAIQLYQKKGFRLDEVRTIYHYWPNK